MTLARFACTALCGLMLAGCEIIVDGTPGPRPYRPEPEPELEVVEAGYTSNYRTVDGYPLICDDHTTILTYHFEYRGDLELWHSYLEGVLTKDVRGEKTWDPNRAGVAEIAPNTFQVNYIIEPLAAPLAVSKDETLVPYAIDVVPVPQPKIIGASKLHLTLVGEGPDANFVSQDIPVINNCP